MIMHGADEYRSLFDRVYTLDAASNESGVAAVAVTP
jgi:hypothetical protein